MTVNANGQIMQQSTHASRVGKASSHESHLWLLGAVSYLVKIKASKQHATVTLGNMAHSTASNG